jgi:hypothetical protein
MSILKGWRQPPEAAQRRRVVRAEGLEPTRLATPEPKSGASANSATPARLLSYAIIDEIGNLLICPA